MSVFVIGEAGSSWAFGDRLANALRIINAVANCGASACKFQWCSDAAAMAKRRNDPVVANYDILCWPREWMPIMKAECEKRSIEWMCTVFLAKDIPVVAPLVKRFKIASAESSDEEFVAAHGYYAKPIIVSYAFGAESLRPMAYQYSLHCVCSYPAPIEQLNLSRIRENAEGRDFHGLSDHTTSVLTGALCVAAGGTICEKHVRLHDTPKDNPDYGHSLICNMNDCVMDDMSGMFRFYVSAIRHAEKAMGTGENVMQECEKPFESRRVK